MFGVAIPQLAIFTGGVLFGTAGLKILGSKDARRVYAHVTAAGLRMKEAVLTGATSIREHASDILAEAHEINERRAEASVVEDKA